MKNSKDIPTSYPKGISKLHRVLTIMLSLMLVLTGWSIFRLYFVMTAIPEQQLKAPLLTGLIISAGVFIVSAIGIYLITGKKGLFPRATNGEEDYRDESMKNVIHTLINNIPDFVYVKDTESKFMIANTAICAFFGVDNPDDIIGKSDFDYIQRESAEQWFSQEQEIIKTGKELINHEEVIPDTKGKIDTVLLTNKIPLRNDTGRIIGLIGIGRDVTDLKKAENSLKGQASEISEGAGALASSVSEIFTVTSQLASSMAELKKSAEVVSHSVEHVSNIAQDSVVTVQAGTKSAEETIETMNHLKEQIETISDRVVALTERNQAIEEIIEVVNGLAEKSNLLAVNASIEASHAGEVGKGFKVVAQEIKALAEQSKQATDQVRSILHEIQKAITASALALEQGLKSVNEGSQKSKDAVQTIEILSNSIEGTAKISRDIAIASRQQFLSIDENAAATKQLESSAREINGLGERLRLLVEKQSGAGETTDD
jgi:PAS domain S-box-containing protein